MEVINQLRYACVCVSARRMYTRAHHAHIHITHEGSSDDLDVPMEACFADNQFKARHSLGSVNSVNVVRLIVQTVHYFYAYLRAAPPGATTPTQEVVAEAETALAEAQLPQI